MRAMRASLFVISVLVAMTSVAAAQDAESYPSRLADRPLVMPDGLSEISMGVSSATYTNAMLGFGEVVQTAMGADHSFGAVEAFGGLTLNVKKPNLPDAQDLAQVRAGVLIPAGDDVAGRIAGFWLFPAEHGVTYFEIDADAVSKRALVPHRLSAFARVGVTFTSLSQHIVAGPSQTQIFSIDGAGELELQVTERFALYGGASVLGPVAHSNPATPQIAGALFAGVLQNLGVVDLSAGLTLRDVTRVADPWAGISVSARF
jgi:hypothetical protein